MLNPKDIPLNPVPDGRWQEDYDKVMECDYVNKKYNRNKRLSMKIRYVNSKLPQVTNGGLKVLDLGPGPGEFLEVCRKYGNEVFGIDAKDGESEMGDEYLDLSSLMVLRQGLPVSYEGVEELVNNGGLPFEDGYFDVVNSQGAIEQICKVCLIGPPCREHKDCRKLSWSDDEDTYSFLKGIFNELKRVTRSGGTILIYANGAKNTSYYDSMVRGICGDLDLELVNSEEMKLHKMRKK